MESWFQDNVPSGTSCEIYTERYHSPRLYSKWNAYRVNHGASPEECQNCLVDGTKFGELATREPDFIVVANSYWHTFLRTYSTIQDSTLTDAGQRFFTMLEENELGYEKCFDYALDLGWSFGMPANHRLIPTLMVYNRHLDGGNKSL